MKLSTFVNAIKQGQQLTFTLPNGAQVPAHYHLTELGISTKHFIDCGGTERTDRHITFQLWVEQDTDHRLTPEKLLRIIDMSKNIIGDNDLEIEAEYQTDTIGRYGIGMAENGFALVAKQTACLAPELCGVPESKKKVSLSELNRNNDSCCTPSSGCC